VVQDTVLSVAKKMHGFIYDPAIGSFKGWLLQLTRWRILNQLKKRSPPDRRGEPAANGTTGVGAMDLIPDPASLDVDAYWNEEWQKNLVDAAIERVKTKASPKQYEIFYLHAVKKFSAAKVAQTLNVNLAQVYLAKYRVSALVKKEVRRLETQKI